jgi:hypothetical protein
MTHRDEGPSARLRCIAVAQRGQSCVSQGNWIALTCLRGFNDAFGDGLTYRCRLGRVAK